MIEGEKGRVLFYIGEENKETNIYREPMTYVISTRHCTLGPNSLATNTHTRWNVLETKQNSLSLSTEISKKREDIFCHIRVNT
jgi:hypothetical protein